MKKNFYYVIGVDGGGVKTFAALANLNGKVLATAKTGSSSPRNVGFEKAIDNLAVAIKLLLKKIKDKNIVSVFLGLPCLEEEFKGKEEKIKKELKKHKEILPIFKGKVIIGSDQLVGFRSGTDKREGIVLIAGSGQVVHGWRGKKEIKISGWGYLTEKGSAFWVGKRGLETVFEHLDGIGSKTLITNLLFQKFHLRKREDLLTKIYSGNLQNNICLISIFVDQAAKRGDKISKKILIEGGKELTKTTKIAIRKLGFQKRKFPLVLIGSMFKSKLILETVKKEIKKFAPEAEIIRPEKEPVFGAIKLAMEGVKLTDNKDI